MACFKSADLSLHRAHSLVLQLLSSSIVDVSMKQVLEELRQEIEVKLASSIQLATSD